MKAHTMRERDSETGDWGGDWQAWLRVARTDIESLGVTLTADSRQDAEYFYLGEDDVQDFYTALMKRGAYFQQSGYPEWSDLNFIELRGDRQTFEWIEGRSPIRDLAANS